MACAGGEEGRGEEEGRAAEGRWGGERQRRREPRLQHATQRAQHTQPSLLTHAQTKQTRQTKRKHKRQAERDAKSARKAEGLEGAGGADATSIFHGKASADYQGRSWLAPPKDRRREPPEAFFLPKKWVHTWSGHTKGVNAVRLFPGSGHLLLSAGLDGKVKVWDVFGSGKCMRTYMGHVKVSCVIFERCCFVVLCLMMTRGEEEREGGEERGGKGGGACVEAGESCWACTAAASS